MIESDIANFVLKPTTITVRRYVVTADHHVTNTSTYHVDTGRGFLLASHSETRLTGVVGRERFAYREIDVLRWKP